MEEKEEDCLLESEPRALKKESAMVDSSES